MGTNIVQALLILLCFPDDAFVTNWRQDPPPANKKINKIKIEIITHFTAGLAWLWRSGTQVALSPRHVYVLFFRLYKGEWVADAPALNILINIGWSSNSTDWHCPDDSLKVCCFPRSSLLMLSPTIALQCCVNDSTLPGLPSGRYVRTLTVYPEFEKLERLCSPVKNLVGIDFILNI